MCMQKYYNYFRFEGLHMKRAMVQSNKSLRIPRWDLRWLPKFTYCKKCHYYAKDMHKIANLWTTIHKLVLKKMLVC